MALGLDLFIAVLAGSITVFLGFIVYLHNRESRTNIIFFFLSIIFSIWTAVNYFSIIIIDHTSIYWIRAVLVSAVPQVFLLLLFVQNFPDVKLVLNRRNLFLTLLLMLLTMALAGSPYVFSNAVIINGQALPVMGALVVPFVGIMAFFTFFTFYLIGKRYAQHNQMVQKQWQVISAGFIIAFLLLIGLVLFPVVILGNTDLVRFAPLFITPIFIGASIAILKHRLFNIKIITTEIFSFMLIFAGVIQLLSATQTLALYIAILVVAVSLIFSVLLIRSVLKEVKQRELLEVLSQQLSVANEQLKILDKVRAEFISIASHQLRTPPATIKWYLSSVLAGDFGELSESLRSALERSNVTNETQIATIDDLLNASRIERGKLEFVFTKSNLEQIVQNLTDQLQPLAQMHKQQIVFHKNSIAIPEMVLDHDKIHQVVNNMLDNAIKYSKAGDIDVLVDRVGDEVLIKVSDHGRGMTPGELALVFDKYARGANSATQATGLGLGMYVAKVIIDQHQGKIWAESDGLGKGSTFIVSLPLNNTQRDIVLDLTKSL